MRLARRSLAAILLASTLVVAADNVPTSATSSVDLTGPAGSGTFGGDFLVLSNGNFVIVDSSYDAPRVANVGAVYLYNGANHTLISTLTGSTAGDAIGSGGLVQVGGGNFVVISRQWDNGAAIDAGAVTWINGVSGLGGSISSANSLVGSAPNDDVGGGGVPGAKGVVVLSNGNYVVSSPNWDRLAAANAGAATWANGLTGVSGPVSASNSVLGSQLNDSVSSGGVTPLTNGNYVVASPDWDTATAVNVGAATVGDGTNGSAFTVDATNSLVGTIDNDHVSSGGVSALTNTNFVVASTQWHKDALNASAGAVTWASGAGATVGQVSGTNSLIGSKANDQVGVVTTLGNGNYVVSSQFWDNGGSNDGGAVTWGSGTGGTTGPVGPVNSIVGTHINDRVGSDGIVELANHNYVVRSTQWNGTLGAASWASGGALTSESVGSGNSLVGSVGGDSVGSDGVFGLANSGFVVASSSWDSTTAMNVGAVTWANAAGTTVGTLTNTNSLVGTNTNDGAGSGGVVALSNGNYVVVSPQWNGPSAIRAGAVTWGAAAGGTAGPINTGNSLYGSSTNDRIGSGGVVALPNANYVVLSPAWNSGPIADAGAATFVLGNAVVFGGLNSTNSLVGGTTNDSVGSGGATVLSNGNYVVDSPAWTSDAVVPAPAAGAVTWATGATGVHGLVSSVNSLVGTIANDRVGSDGIQVLADGAYLVKSYLWDNAGIIDAGAITFGGPFGVQGAINSFNSLRGLTAADFNAASTARTTEGTLLVSRVSRNVVSLFLADATPPVFAAAQNVTAVAAPGAASVVVNYAKPVATDNIGIPAVACTPASGTAFPIGVTTVTCIATNTENLTATTTFTVTVTVGTDYVPLSPARLADTRPDHTTVDGQAAGTGEVPLGSTVQLTVAGRGGVPADAVAVSLNVTVTEAKAAGFVTVYPCGAAIPTASNLNYDTGATIPNAVISKIGDGGRVCIFASQPLQLVVDVEGFFPPATTYHAIVPARVLDTRAGHGTVDGLQQATGVVKAGSVTTLQVTGRAGVPADASAVVLNVTITEPTSAGYATVYPCGTTPPLASNLNYTPGLTIPNLVLAKIGANGTVCIANQSETQIVADVNGYFPAATGYKALNPARLLDTRTGQTTVDGVSAGGGTVPLGVVTSLHVAGRGGVPNDAVTVALNVTVTQAVTNGYLTVYPCGIDPPLASNLNYVAGQTIPNLVITKIGTGGNVCIFNSQPLDVIADINGYFP